MKKITFISLFISLLLTASLSSQNTANYTVTVNTIWNVASHTSVPSDPHWSPLSGATHKNPNDILEFGNTAPLTNGIKDIAETGSTNNFKSEINGNSNTDQYLQAGFSPRGAENSIATLSNITVSEDFPYITLVSMVAPSPDWFIATNSENLRSGNNAVNNGWKDTYSIDMFAYDSGTDDGTEYESNDIVSNPRQNISMITGTPINGNRMATITFTYNSSTLTIKDSDNLQTFSVFPNPAKDHIVITNINQAQLVNLEIYNVFGNLVKQSPINSETSTLNYNVSNLANGVYFLKLNTKTGDVKTQKIVIN